jgi:NADH-quinone oxidoreductase subunit J
MDSLHAISFYVSAALAVVGGVVIAFLNGHWNRGVALAAIGLGLAGIYASLSAGFAAVVVLVCYAGCALLVARPDYRTVGLPVGRVWRQLGAVGAALLFGTLAYAAFRGQYAHAVFSGYEPGVVKVGAFDSVAVTRLLFAHDALATEAIGAVVLVTLVGAAVFWRRERPRDEREGRR